MTPRVSLSAVAIVCAISLAQMPIRRDQPPIRWLIAYSPPSDISRDVEKCFVYDNEWKIRDEGIFRRVELERGVSLFIHPSTYGIDSILESSRFLKEIEGKVLNARNGEVTLSNDEIEALTRIGVIGNSIYREYVLKEPLSVWSAQLFIVGSDGAEFTNTDGNEASATTTLREASRRLGTMSFDSHVPGDLTNNLKRRQSSFAITPVAGLIPSGIVSPVLRDSEEAAKDWRDEANDALRAAGKSVFEHLSELRYPFLAGLPREGATLDQLPDSMQASIREYYARRWAGLGYESQALAEENLKRVSFQIRPMISIITAMPSSNTQGGGSFHVGKIRM